MLSAFKGKKEENKEDTAVSQIVKVQNISSLVRNNCYLNLFQLLQTVVIHKVSLNLEWQEEVT